MCLWRFALAVYGYVEPVLLMEQLAAPQATNIQMPYIIRVWAIRDIVIAVLVAISGKNTIKTLLAACIAIDLTDMVSAQLSNASGLFNAADTLSLQVTVIGALIPEIIALILIIRSKQNGKNA
jgi:hypothetical protein